MKESPLTYLFDILAKHFYKPDLQAIRIVLGTMQSHYLKLGDPAWLFLVAPPGSGKTTISIMGASGLNQVLMLSDVTENTFLSGFHGHKQPGLLEKIGETVTEGMTQTTTGDVMLLVKDFTTVLSMRREKRGAILSQLREIHDGMFKRDFGTGASKIWQGRATVIAAVTPILDRYYSVFSALGERFLQVRCHRPDSEEAGEWAIQQQGQEEEIRKQIQEAVKALFAYAIRKLPTLTPRMRKRIAALAEVIALGRTHVYRDSYGSREIEYVPEPEANTRIAKQLSALAIGIASLNRHSSVTEEEFDDVVRVAFDCLPDRRRPLLDAMVRGEEPESVSMADVARQRVLEEMEAVGVLESETIESQVWGTEDGQEWSLTSRVRKLLITAGVMQNQSVREGAVVELKNPPESNGEISKKNSHRANTLVVTEVAE